MIDHAVARHLDGNTVVLLWAGGIITYSQAFTPANADTEFPLGQHQVTGEDMGTATYMQAYLLLSALFVAIASAQDAAREAAENAPPVEVPEP